MVSHMPKTIIVYKLCLMDGLWKYVVLQYLFVTIITIMKKWDNKFFIRLNNIGIIWSKHVLYIIN